VKTIVRLFATLALIAALPAAAQDDAVPKEALQLIDSLHYQSGKINVDAAHATLNLNTEFRFLDAAFRFTRSGSFFFPVSRFHSSKV